MHYSFSSCNVFLILVKFYVIIIIISNGKDDFMIKRKKPINKISKVKKVVKKSSVKSINKRRKDSRKYLPDIIEKRFVFITIIILMLFSVISFRIFKL